MEVLSRLLLGGAVSGTLTLNVDALSVVDERIEEAVIRLDVAPPIKSGARRPMSVTTGMSPLRSAWRNTIMFSLKPLARAVRT